MTIGSGSGYMAVLQEAILMGRQILAKKELKQVDGENFRRCSICGDPVEIWIKLLGEAEELVPCMCACDIELQKKQKEAEELQDRLLRIQGNREDGIHDKRYEQFTFENDWYPDSNESKIAKKYVENWDQMFANNVGLLFTGQVGRGKTYYACAIGNALLDLGVSVGITTVMDAVARAFGSRDKDEELRRLQSYDLLILDEFGAERATEYSREQVFSIIDGRSRSGKPTIFTTNLDKVRLQNPVDLYETRVFDRVLTMGSVVISMNGQNIRAVERSRKQQSAIEKLFGND